MKHQPTSFLLFGVDNMMQVASYNLIDHQSWMKNASTKVEPLKDDNTKRLSRFDYYNHSSSIFKLIQKYSHFFNNGGNSMCFILVVSNPLKPSIHSISCSMKILKSVICVTSRKNSKPETVVSDKQIIMKTLSHNIFKCKGDTYISVINVCDGTADCPTIGDDEQNCTCKTNGLAINNNIYCSQICHPSNCSCPPMYIQNLSGGCKIFGEISTNHTFRRIQLKIQSNKDMEFLTNLLLYTNYSLLQNENYQCPTGMRNCYSGLKECYSPYKLCQYSLNIPSGTLSVCINGRHLENCETFICPSTFKCPNSYCIPYGYLCNGKWDCWDGSDEINCVARSCAGLFKCRNSLVCIPLKLVCNHVVDCTYADDENFCQSCLKGCICLGMAILCQHISFKHPEMSSLSTFLSVIISQSQFHYNINFYNALKILISKTLLPEFWQVIQPGNYEYLHSIEMTFDQMQQIKMHPSNTQLITLRYLNVSNNVINKILYNAFVSLNMLHHLDLSNNRLNLLQVGTFHGLHVLKSLTLVGNLLYKVNYETFYFIQVKLIFIENQALCCKSNDSKVMCTDELSMTDCKNISILKIIGVIVSLIILFINGLLSCHLVGKYLKRTEKKSTNIYKISTAALHLSGFCTGLYILLITFLHYFNNIQYIGEYIFVEKSIICTLLYFISTFSVLLSCELTSLIALSRFLVIVYSNKKYLTVRKTYIFVFCGVVFNFWVLLFPYSKKYNMQSSLCFIMCTKGQSSKIAYLGMSITFILTFIFTSVIYIILFKTIAHLNDELIKSFENHVKEKKYFSYLMKAGITVVSMGSFYIPLSILTFNLAYDERSNADYFQYVLVFFILPSNCLINPFLYNFPELKYVWVTIVQYCG